MSQDHYAILGVAPTAPPAVIRAAYLALMREYHPDRNQSPAAAGRAQAIVAAYKVLGDFDRRSQYDWDRRREREAAAAALAGAPKRRVSASVASVAAIGLAAIGAVLLRPDSADERLSAGPARSEESKAKIEPAPKAKRVAAARHDKAVKPAEEKPRPEPVRVATVEKATIRATPVGPAPAKTKLAEANPSPPRAKAKVVLAEATQSRPRIKPSVAAPPPPKPKARPAAIAAAEPKRAPEPKPSAGGDLASLDRFVMSFYGQSWRFGDAEKRAALQQSRDGFVVRRGACLADACKRAAYLKLMRDVSQIVESRQPKAP